MRKNISLRFDQDIHTFLAHEYRGKFFKIISKSLDARRANVGRTPKFNYCLDILDKSVSEKVEHFSKINDVGERPIIVGMGPAGIFCALRLLEYGIKSIIIERGKRINERMVDIAKFWRTGILDENSNMCFGEGGAGLFSDGKLFSRVKSPYINYVLSSLIKFGADPSISYLTAPYIGSNKLRAIIYRIREYLESSGVDIVFGNAVVDLSINSSSREVSGVILSSGEKVKGAKVVLATGHSSIDIYKLLKEYNLDLERKDFAVGVRLEHPRSYIDKLQYGKFAGTPELGAARYNLKYFNKKTGRGVYSFCMCPGGYVVSSGTDRNGLVSNGMSNSGHNSPWSNSGIIVTVKNKTDLGDDIFSGIDFCRKIEERSGYEAMRRGAKRELPACALKDFMRGKVALKNSLISSSPSGIFQADFADFFPDFILEHLREGLDHFNQLLKGVIDNNAILIAPETRTSSPLTVVRDPVTFESNIKGLYPCGEGAGYAGGITSSAIDGVKVAESIRDQ